MFPGPVLMKQAHNVNDNNIIRNVELCKVNKGNFVCGATSFLSDFCYTMRVVTALPGVLCSYQ